MPSASPTTQAASSRCCASTARATSRRSALIGDGAPAARASRWSASPIRRRKAAARAISTVTARRGIAADDEPLEAAPALGFSGAAALDAQGRFAGMVVLKAPVVAGPSSPPRAAVVPAERIRNFLEAQLRRAPARPARRPVVRVICVRK